MDLKHIIVIDDVIYLILESWKADRGEKHPHGNLIHVLLYKNEIVFYNFRTKNFALKADNGLEKDYYTKNNRANSNFFFKQYNYKRIK